MGEVRYIFGIIIGVILLILSFYPLDLFLPEIWWPLFPDIIIHYPIMFLLSQLIPAIFWFSLFIIGVLMIRSLIKS